MTRRSFAKIVGASGALAAGSLLAGCKSSTAEAPSNVITDDILDAAPTAEDLLEERVKSFVDNMSIEEKIAQLFMVRPEAITGYDAVIQAGEATQKALARNPVCGITYFSQNLIDPGQTTAMLEATLQFGYEAMGLPLLLAVDEEGGSVTRIAGNEAFGQTDVGHAADIGATGDTENAAAAATAIAGYLKPLGFNLDFAPVLDIANNPESDTMTQRSFGSDAQLVSDMGVAEIKAFADAGMLCCAKHFPGIGGAEGDSHEVSIYSEKTLAEISEVELVPFAAAIGAGVPMIMVGHLSAPNIIGDNTPASLAPAIVTDVLRDKLEYDGVVITDALEMAAAEGVYEDTELALLAIEAGCDIALMPPDYEAAYMGILEAISSGRLKEARIDESLTRIIRMKLQYLEG